MPPSCCPDLREQAGWSFVITMALCLLIGVLLVVIKKPKNRYFILRRICNSFPVLGGYEVLWERCRFVQRITSPVDAY